MAFGQPYNPMGYTPYYTPGQAAPDQLAQLRSPYQQQAQQAAQQNGIVWVQGEAGAKSYLVGAGNSVLLMDSESQTFYLKTADPSGMPSMRIFDYTERAQSQRPTPAQMQPQQQQDYVTRAEFNELIARLEAPAPTKKKQKEVPQDVEPAV